MTAEDIQRFDCVLATFDPKNRDTLKPGTEGFIGRRCAWTAAWIIESGPYEGQWAMMPMLPRAELPLGENFSSFAWAPFEDLSDAEDPPPGYGWLSPP